MTSKLSLATGGVAGGVKIEEGATTVGGFNVASGGGFSTTSEVELSSGRVLRRCSATDWRSAK
jgi:hypothetical protein